LLQIRADRPHPAAGNGLFYRLDLPTNFSDEEAREWAAKLNRAARSPKFVREICVEQLCMVMRSHALRATDAPATL
jgi:hypothetical protein